MTCPTCARENRAGRKFCAGCGSTLLVQCRACNASNEPDDTFCGECGRPLGGEQLPPRAPVSAVLEAATGPITPTGERRHLTVMFCDLVGSTALSEKLDPEDLRDVIHAYQEVCVGVIERYDGHVAQYLGDGLLAYFGYPTAHEEDARRAIQASREICAAMGPLQDKLGAMAEIAVRIGLHSGLVVIGEVGAGERREHLALGETPNVAARVQGLAATNTVAISEDTRRLARGYFVYDALGPQTLKGISQPVPIYLVVGETDALGRLEAGPMLTPLVGREVETATLADRWERVAAGAMHIVVIAGEAGIGKSRLIHGLRDRLSRSGEPHAWVELRASELHQGSALHPVIVHLQRLLRFGADDEPDERTARLESLLQEYGFDTREALPLFCALLSLPLPAGRLPLDLSPELQKQRTIQATVTWLLAEAARRPLVVVFEDLHWIDPSSLDLLAAVLADRRQAPVLVVLSARPEFTPSWEIDGRFTFMTVDRLSRDDSVGMIARIAGRPLPQELCERLLALTDGVPLFTEELTKAVLDGDLLTEREGRFELRRPLATLDVPATLQESLLARLDKLGAARDVAQIGAVLGREFSYPLIQVVSGLDHDSLRRELAKLVESGLVMQRQRPPFASYTFKHALVQDAAYSALLRARRREIHERTARRLEDRFPEVATTQPEIVARHFAQGARAEEAVAWWGKAAVLDAGRGNHAEAAQHCREGLALLADLPAGAERDMTELQLQSVAGASLAARLGYAAPVAEQAYSRAVELARQLGETPGSVQPVVGLWAYHLLRSNHQSGKALARQVVDIGDAAGDHSIRAQGLGSLGWSLMCLGELSAARDAFEQAAGIAHDFCDRPWVNFQPGDVPIGILGGLVSVLAAMGHLGQAQRRNQDLLDRADAPDVWGPHFSRAAACAYSSYYYLLFLHDPVAGAKHAATTLAIGSERGYAGWQITGMLNLAIARAELGEAPEAIETLKQGIALWRAAGAELNVGFFLWGLARAQRSVGDRGAAIVTLDEALAMTDASDEHQITSELLRLRGDIALEHDAAAADHAAAHFERAIALARRQQAKLFELRAVRSLHGLRAGQGRGAETFAPLEALLGCFDEQHSAFDLRQARTLLEATRPHP